MRDHTSLKAWQSAREVAVASARLCRHYWKPWASAAYEQLQRASLSVQLNIAEGYALRSVGRTRQLWLTAYGSAVETVDCLVMLKELGAAPDPILDPALQTARASAALVLGLLGSLEKRVTR
jgi:four helix bundle protein